MAYIYLGDILKKVRIFLFNGLLLTVTTFVIRTIDTVFNIYIANKIGTEAVGVFQLILSCLPY